MKRLVLITIFLSLFITSNSQTRYNKQKWFYNLPLKLTSRDIINEIRQRKAFVELENADTFNTSKDLKKPVYSGLIKEPRFSNPQYIDSATIKIYSGYRRNNKVQLSKVLVLEYFIKDTAALEYLYYDGKYDLEKTSKKDVSSRSHPDQMEFQSRGMIYVYSKKPMVISSIWRRYYDNGKMSLMIISESPDH